VTVPAYLGRFYFREEMDMIHEVREFLDRTHPNRTSSMVADGVVYVTLPGIMPKHLTYRQADIVPTATNAIESARR